MTDRTINSVRVALCVGRHRYRTVDDAREVAYRHEDTGWWSCPLCDRHHIGPPLTLNALEDLAWVARTLAGNEPGTTQPDTEVGMPW